MSIDIAKETLREEILKKRVATHHMSRERASMAIRDLFFSTIPLQPQSVVAGYWPLTGEVDTTPLLHQLHDKGHSVCLPVVTDHKAPLIFRTWTPDTTLSEGYAGTRVPGADAAILNPDFIIVPLVAFDRAGYRLGYGGGFYDRTLNAMRLTRPVTAIGIAYAVQQVPLVPHDGSDAKLDWVITEESAIQCG
jgi:5-formyltetrahydrofolate cyclo-ligase